MKQLSFIILLLIAFNSFSQENEKKKHSLEHYKSNYEGPALASNSSKFLGNLNTINDANYHLLWNQLTPENEGKWVSVGTTPDSTKWNWKPVTELYNYAKSHNLKFKFHTLIWGNQQPDWISDLDKDEQLKYIETWIRQVGKRFPDMEMVDVVNEALPYHFPPNGKRETANYINALGGEGETGYDWVIKSFELARKYIPNSKLLINDFSIINKDSATTDYLEIINLLNTRGLIDGIGIQAHQGELNSVPVSTLKRNLDRLSATGLPLYISEMDLGNKTKLKDANDQDQLELYQKIFPVLWEHPGIKGITFWGYVEGKMWKKHCYLIRRDGTWRPAMKWLEKYVSGNPQ